MSNAVMRKAGQSELNRINKRKYVAEKDMQDIKATRDSLSAELLGLESKIVEKREELQGFNERLNNGKSDFSLRQSEAIEKDNRLKIELSKTAISKSKYETEFNKYVVLSEKLENAKTYHETQSTEIEKNKIYLSILITRNEKLQSELTAKLKSLNERASIVEGKEDGVFRDKEALETSNKDLAVRMAQYEEGQRKLKSDQTLFRQERNKYFEQANQERRDKKGKKKR